MNNNVNVKLREGDMSELRDEGDGFSKLSVAELAQAYVESVQAAEATEHVGRHNRLARRCSQILQELKTRGELRAVLQRLADHSDADVRKWASSSLTWLDRPDTKTAQESAPRRRLRWQTTWQSDNPPPPALTRDEIARRLDGVLPDFCDPLMDLALPAIGLWPQQRAKVEPTASRFGGIPLAPPDWQWPIAEEEPLLFVGQINCAELNGLPGAELLPASGLLAFFGDHDAVTGCFPFDDHCVFYWPDVHRLVPARARLDPIEVFPSCALVPRPGLDLPDPHSRTIRDLQLNKVQASLYTEEWEALRCHGLPYGVESYCSFGKLLGWPALVQPTHDLDRFEDQDDARLLLQVDQYCNGEELHGWGPGGSLYYVMPEHDLRAQFFESCELEGQFT